MAEIIKHEEMTPDEIRQNREALGLSQRQLAELWGVTENTIYRQEAGTSRVEAPGMMRLAFQALRAAQLNSDPELLKLQADVTAKIAALQQRIKRGRPKRN